MTIKKQLVRSLVRLYPQFWRAEYGEELAQLLLSRPATTSVVGDVLLSATREHVRRDEPWKVCGALLLLWTTAGIVLHNLFSVSTVLFSYYNAIAECILIAAPLWTTMRQDDGIGAAISAAMKAILLGSLPTLPMFFLWMLGVINPLTKTMNAAGQDVFTLTWFPLFSFQGTGTPPGPFVLLLSFFALMPLTAASMGVLGLLLGRLAVAVRRRRSTGIQAE
jgi:hypothetical protein